MQFTNMFKNHKAIPFLSAGSLVFNKTAGDPALAGPVDHQTAALKQVLGLGLSGLGVGAGARSLFGLRELLSRDLGKNRVAPRPAVISVRVPTVQEEEEEEPVRRLSRGFGSMKQAEGEEQRAPLMQRLLPFMSGDWWSGKNESNAMNKPWFLPAATAATLGGLYGGYKLVDKGMDITRKMDRKSELENAKDEYRRALIEQYAPDSPAVKRGEQQSELGKDLDTLYSLCKDGIVKEGILGTAAGMYATLAGLLAAGSGAAAYNWSKSKSPDERLANAIKQRERLRWAARPPEIYAVSKPLPVRIGTPKTQNTEDEDTEQKIAENIAALYKP